MVKIDIRLEHRPWPSIRAYLHVYGEDGTVLLNYYHFGAYTDHKQLEKQR
jgi:hypothetical protein